VGRLVSCVSGCAGHYLFPLHVIVYTLRPHQEDVQLEGCEPGAGRNAGVICDVGVLSRCSCSLQAPAPMAFPTSVSGEALRR
jgi:hypothetical protein